MGPRRVGPRRDWAPAAAKGAAPPKGGPAAPKGAPPPQRAPPKGPQNTEHQRA